MKGIVKIKLLLRLVAIGSVLSLLVACASPPFPRHKLAALPELTSAQLLEKCWLSGGQRYLCRHSGLLEVFSRKIPLEGVVKVDTQSNTARLVAMDSMGVKLFDLSITGVDYQLNYLLPQLAKHEKLPQMIATSVRRIFLAPQPTVQDELRRLDDEYILASHDGNTQFSFIGLPLRLRSKVMHSAIEHWRVDYYQYTDFFLTTGAKDTNSVWAPSGIVLDDAGGFRLTLWIQELRKL
jgi:hypothetical protein